MVPEASSIAVLAIKKLVIMTKDTFFFSQMYFFDALILCIKEARIGDIRMSLMQL